MHHRTLNTPLELIENCAKKKQIRALKVFLALKFLYSGQARHAALDWQQVGDIAGFKDVRTLQKHVRTCVELDWIGDDGEWYFVRSFERVREITESTTRTAIEISPKHVKTILELALPAKIQSRAKAKRYARKKARAKQTTKEPFTSLEPSENSPYPDTAVSCSLIGLWYGLDPSGASRLKARARRAGYTTYRHRYQTIGAHRSNFMAVAESIEPERLTVRDDEVVIRLTDLFTPAHYNFKTRRSL